VLRTPLPFSVVAAGLLALAGEAWGQAPRIAGFDIDGGIDPADRLQAFAADIAPPGSFFVEAGAADREGTPISTEPRLIHAFDQIGYFATVQREPPRDGEVRLHIHLRAYDRIRQIFVSGVTLALGRIRQEEIIQRLSLRPGQALPVPGRRREARIEAERQRVLDFLHAQGYLDAEVTIRLRSTDAIPSPVNLTVKVDLGQGYPLGPIGVRGNKVLPSATIAEKVRHGSWYTLWTQPLPFRQSLLRQDLAALTERYRQLGYAGARLSYNVVTDPGAKLVRLQLEINERKHVEVAFEGNRRASDDTLRDQLTIFTRGAYDDYELESSAEAVAEYYREKRGNMLVKVRWQRQRLSPEEDRVVFTIDEGPVIKVRSVEFVGNRGLPSRQLGAVVNVRVYPFLGLGGGGYTTQKQLTADTDNLTAYYRALGFPDAQVRCEIAPASRRFLTLGPVPASAEGEWRTSSVLHVRFLVEEGARTVIAAIRFAPAPGDPGPLPRDPRFLRELLASTVGGPYQPGLVREDLERLKRYLGDLGYPQASAEPQVSRSGDRATIDWQIKVGPQVHIGPVFVRGNFVTREKTILMWVPLESGSPLTTTAVERGQRNLALIQLFNNPNPITFPGEGPTDALVPMLIEVEERHDHWGVLRVGFGLSTEQYLPTSQIPFGLLYGALGYEHRNLFGFGWKFLASGNLGPSLVRGTASFVDPRFLGSLFRLEVGANYLRQTTERFGDLRSGSGFVGFSREMYPGVDASIRYNIRETLRNEFFQRGAGADEDQQAVRIGTTEGSVSMGVDWLRLDNPLIPTRGFKLNAQIEMALPELSLKNGVDTFLKFSARSLAVVPLTPWLSLRHSVRYDQGLPIGAPLLPKVERYFAGGDTTIRGLELDRARTEAIHAPIIGGVDVATYRPVGGSLRILHNVDLQFPILPPWYGAVFLDSGVIADSIRSLGAAQFRHGAGVSPLLIKLPVGDISVSWGWPLDPQPGDSVTGRLHINVGLMF
jgi:outer membrane protein insertion porin family